MNLDDLVYELEVETEVIRAISHLTPNQASEFLFKLALKIRRTCKLQDISITVKPQSETTAVPTEEPRSDPEPPLNLIKKGKGHQSQKIIDYLREKGPIQRCRLARELGAERGVPPNTVRSLIYQLMKKGILQQDHQGRISISNVQ
jgi:Penicillinase repressor